MTVVCTYQRDLGSTSANGRFSPADQGMQKGRSEWFAELGCARKQKGLAVLGLEL